MARKFFLVAAGMFLLALSYHLGASTATAQAPSNPVVASNEHGIVVTANGDVYGWGTSSYVFRSNVFESAGRPQAPGDPITALGQSTVVTANGEEFMSPGGAGTSWTYRVNVFTGSPTSALHQSWGQVKARYQNTPSVSVTPRADSK